MKNIDIQKIANTVIRGEKAITFPVRFHSEYIFDANGKMIAEIRGWGWIQYMESEEEATEFQDSIGEWIEQALNESWERSNEALPPPVINPPPTIEKGI